MKVARGVLERNFRMGERMQSLVRRMPIVEAVVVQKRSPHHFPLMRLDAESGGNAQTHHRDGDRVRVGGGRPVLHEALFGLHPLRGKNVAAVFLHDGHKFRIRLFHSLRSYCTQIGGKCQLHAEKNRI